MKIQKLIQKSTNGIAYERNLIYIPKEHSEKMSGEIVMDSSDGILIAIQKDKYNYEKIKQALKILGE